MWIHDLNQIHGCVKSRRTANTKYDNELSLLSVISKPWSIMVYDSHYIAIANAT